MAELTLTTIAELIKDYTATYFDASDDINKRFGSAYAHLPKRAWVNSSGNKYKQPISFTNSGAGSTDPTSDSPRAGLTPTVDAFEIPARYHDASIDIELPAKLAKKYGLLDPDPTQAGAQAAALQDDLIKPLMIDVERAIVLDGTGNSNKDLVGIDTYLVDSGTVHGVDMSVSGISPQVDSTTTYPTIDAIQSIVNTLRGKPANAKNLEIWCSINMAAVLADIYNNRGGIYRPYQMPNGGDVTQVLSIHGCPVIPISEYPDTRIDFLNITDWFFSWFLKPGDDGSVVTPQLDSYNDKISMICAGAVICRNPAANGTMNNLSI